MSLYYMQKLIFQLNRDPALRERFGQNMAEVLEDFDLTGEEVDAILKPDIGLMYVLGVNGQLLMHYAAMRGYEWNEYMEAMRQGVAEHGPVRDGLYAMTTDGHVVT